MNKIFDTHTVVDKSIDGFKREPALMIIKHQDDNRYYVSCSSNLYISYYNYIGKLKRNTSTIHDLQNLFNLDMDLNKIKFYGIYVKDINEGYVIKQSILDEYLNTGILYNQTLVANIHICGTNQHTVKGKELMRDLKLNKVTRLKLTP